MSQQEEVKGSSLKPHLSTTSNDSDKGSDSSGMAFSKVKSREALLYERFGKNGVTAETFLSLDQIMTLVEKTVAPRAITEWEKQHVADIFDRASSAGQYKEILLYDFGSGKIFR